MDEPAKTIEKRDNLGYEEVFDYKPLPKGKVAGLEEFLFSLMRRKKPVPKQSAPAPAVVKTNPIDGHVISEKFTGISPIRKKTLAEKVLVQVKFPVISKAAAIINGCSLVVFAAGTYLLYSELPSRPELILGILMVSVAGNVIISRR